MEVKIFRFRVSNAASAAFEKDKTEKWYQNKLLEIDSPEYIENTINDFIKNKENVTIYITSVDVNYHNNGRGNTIDLIYTILYSV